MKFKKRIFSFVLIAVLIVQTGILAGAAAPNYNAIYATPTIDGTVNNNEYGAPQPLNKSNASIFFCNVVDITKGNNIENITFPDLTYRFAWDENNLYTAVTIKNVESIETSKFQIDVSPEKGIRDKQKGVFFTFQILDAKNNKMSVTRHNYQTADTLNREDVNITKAAKTSVKVAGGVTSMEVAIPIAELKVKPSKQLGSGKDFTGISMKAGTWGIATYFIGNGAGFTTSKGANNHTIVSTDIKTGKLVEFYNDIVFAAKPANVTTTPAKPTTTNTKDGNNTTATTDGSNVSTDPSDTNLTEIETTDENGTTTTTGSEKTTIAANATTTSKPPSNKANIGLILGAIAAVLVVGGGAAAAFFILRKRNMS